MMDMMTVPPQDTHLSLCLAVRPIDPVLIGEGPGYQQPFSIGRDVHWGSRGEKAQHWYQGEQLDLGSMQMVRGYAGVLKPTKNVLLDLLMQ